MKKAGIALAFLLALIPVFSESAGGKAETALVQGFNAYRNEDWHSAMIFLRQAVTSPSVSTDETWYMLIMCEMYAGEYASAHADCEQFFKLFAFSRYAPYVQYQEGRCLHFLNQNENAVLVLSDFCHQNQNSELYASALYWIAESFFAEYNYDSARALYERIVSDFPADSKVGAAQYRIEAIDQRSREEKLLYLLKVTGEENLASREEYERQLRQYEAEDKLGLRQQLATAEARISELEQALAAQKAAGVIVLPAEGQGVHDVVQPVAASKPAAGEATATAAPTAVEEDAEVLALKRKARQLKYLLDEQKSMEEAE
ncbi:MAG: tetratricopeptide repeat protein [Treponema sp.]|nr:tetratricopeptide repeat protein [Treponema sp.]